MIAKQGDRIGTGIYTVSEAARIVRVRPQSLSRWVFGSAAGEPVLRADFAHDNDKVVSFLDMIQCLAIRAVRVSKPGISLQQIREAVRLAEDEYHISQPLARRHAMYIYGNRLLLSIEDRQELIGLKKGEDRHQLYLKQVVELYLEQIEFSTDGLADKWIPMKRDPYAIVIDPEIRFGAPVLMPGVLKIDAIVQSVETEGGIDEAASMHDIDKDAVRLALHYQDILAGNAA